MTREQIHWTHHCRQGHTGRCCAGETSEREGEGAGERGRERERKGERGREREREGERECSGEKGMVILLSVKFSLLYQHHALSKLSLTRCLGDTH